MKYDFTLASVKKEIEELLGDLLYEFFSEKINTIDEVINVNYKVKENHISLVFNKKECKKWFLEKSRDFGSFYEINSKYLLYIFVGISAIHYGIVKHNQYKIIHALESDKSYGLKFRPWKKLKWFSESVSLHKNLDILKNENNKFKNGIKELIDKVKKDDIDK